MTSLSRIYHRAMSIMTSKALLLAAAAAVVVCLGSFARQNFRGEIISSSLRSTSYELLDTTGPLSRLKAANIKSDNSDSYFVFLQKFPLENTWGLLFHTEVVVCPRNTFDEDFTTVLDSLAEKLSPSAKSTDEKVPFVQVPEEQWIKQSESKCVELGYGGSPCTTPCCGSPHRNENTNYALNSRQAVISNAVGEEKQLFLYGKKHGISGMDAYRAVCHGQNKRNMMAAIDGGDKLLPKCVSNWSGEDYNPITNNCNTYTSTVLKCVYGLSDQKPDLGVSDMVGVTCPTEKTEDGEITQQCLIPTQTTVMNLRNIDVIDGVETKTEE